jgi:hypothetical protein
MFHSDVADQHKIVFVFSLGFVVLVVAIFVFDEDLYSLGGPFVAIAAYTAALMASIAFLVRRPKAILFLLLASVAIAGLAWMVSGSGYPVSSATTGTSTTCTTVTNSTDGLVQSLCTQQTYPTQDIPRAMTLNLIAWAPLVGCFLYSMPELRKEELVSYKNIGRLFRGAAPAAVLMFDLMGAYSQDGFYSPILGLGPLNPFVAYRECDSTTSLNGCVFVNSTFLLVDFLFWFAVACLVSLLVAEIYDSFIQRRANPRAADVDVIE